MTDPALASLRIETRMDSLGNYTGDAEVFQSKKPTKVYLSSRFERIPVRDYGSVTAVPEDSARYFRLALISPFQYPNGEVRYLDKAGNLYAVDFFEEGKWLLPYRFYHPNGVLSSMTSQTSEQEMKTNAWYSTGQTRKTETRTARPGQSEASMLSGFWLASGEPLVVGGNGAFRDTVTFGDQKLIETGTYLNGQKDGPWQGVFTDEKPYYNEEYRAGELLKGVSYTRDGNRVEYTIQEQQAEFRGGLSALGAFLTRNLRYPANAQRARVQGKVFVSFVVETDGRLSDIRAQNHPDSELEAEAIRVIQEMSGSWKPGLQRGRPVKTRFMLPITFQLQ